MIFRNFHPINDEDIRMMANPTGPYRYYHSATNCYHREPEITDKGETKNPILTPEQKEMLSGFAIFAAGIAGVIVAIGAGSAVNKHVFGLDVDSRK